MEAGMDLVDTYVSSTQNSLKTLFAAQRASIPGNHRVVEAGTARATIELLLNSVIGGATVILRGFSLLRELPVAQAIEHGRSMVVDHAEGEVPSRPEDRIRLQSMRRILTYSSHDFGGLRDMGVVRVTQVPTPYLYREAPPLPEVSAYGFIPLFPSWRDTLTRFVRARDADVSALRPPIYCTEQAVGVERVTSEADVIRMATLLVLPDESRDTGCVSPVTLSYRGLGRRIVTTRKRALSAIAIPPNEGVHLVPSHMESAYYTYAARAMKPPGPGAPFAEPPGPAVAQRSIEAFTRCVCGVRT